MGGGLAVDQAAAGRSAAAWRMRAAAGRRGCAHHRGRKSRRACGRSAAPENSAPTNVLADKPRTIMYIV